MIQPASSKPYGIWPSNFMPSRHVEQPSKCVFHKPAIETGTSRTADLHAFYPSRKPRPCYVVFPVVRFCEYEDLPLAFFNSTNPFNKIHVGVHQQIITNLSASALLLWLMHTNDVSIALNPSA